MVVLVLMMYDYTIKDIIKEIINEWVGFSLSDNLSIKHQTGFWGGNMWSLSHHGDQTSLKQILLMGTLWLS